MATIGNSFYEEYEDGSNEDKPIDLNEVSSLYSELPLQTQLALTLRAKQYTKMKREDLIQMLTRLDVQKEVEKCLMIKMGLTREFSNDPSFPPDSLG